MTDHTTMSLRPGVIVVAEPEVSSLLRGCGVEWDVQERQPNIAQMWSSLSSGRLNAHSRILVFSDSLHRGEPNEADEREQTARAIVAMANAKARVFVAVWHSAELESLRVQIDREAVTSGVDPDSIVVHFIPMEKGDCEALECMRAALEFEMDWPQELSFTSDASPQVITLNVDPDLAGIPALSETAQSPAAAASPHTPPAASISPSESSAGPAVSTSEFSHRAPSMPHLGIGQPPTSEPQIGSSTSGASQELLARPPLAGQVTITVTSSKGGSGKSTAALLLAASIARASKEGGKPLSVCVVDMDTRDGQVASLIGKYMPTALNIRVQPVWDELTIRRHLVFEEALGVHALLAPIRPRTADTVGPEFYRTIIRSLQRLFDVVVMDTSVQYLDPLIAKVCLPEATEVLFITTLASTAVQGMARALREITAPAEESGLGISRDKIGIIVNQSVAGVGMQREQILAAGLGVPVVGVIPLATKDVLTATNLHRMHTLLDHPLIGPAYNELARTCLPGRGLAEFEVQMPSASSVGMAGSISVETTTVALPLSADAETIRESEPELASASRKKGLFRRV
ncbi:MAG: AAA family ATPase [Candidatus Nanopelagicales bacterium]